MNHLLECQAGRNEQCYHLRWVPLNECSLLPYSAPSVKHKPLLRYFTFIYLVMTHSVWQRCSELSAKRSLWEKACDKPDKFLWHFCSTCAIWSHIPLWFFQYSNHRLNGFNSNVLYLLYIFNELMVNRAYEKAGFVLRSGCLLWLWKICHLRS